MFEVLVFVYENYYAGDSCPEPAHLERKLNAVGFESDEIEDALQWLCGLNAAARCSAGFNGTSQLVSPEPWLREPCATSARIYTEAERIRRDFPLRGNGIKCQDWVVHSI